MSVTIYTGIDEEYIHILSREPGSNFNGGFIEVDEETAKRWENSIAAHNVTQREIRAALAAHLTSVETRVAHDKALEGGFNGRFEGPTGFDVTDEVTLH